MSEQHLLIDYYQSVMVITLNRPDSLNAFSAEMILGLTDALKEKRKPIFQGK
ncbi:enoyl-CoA hydratase-related protein [Bacillus sp. CGMCC 1.16541]|uniref:enoyl-CoA hydratase-related protein n=1 Tax=Bacillus sp. CGMCC 1.16541 TaxID=2185143 RepID=UPI0013A58D4F|nr:enoyl-CoA hydratase-related protein [Bacillus sp. CGMCC 1.16541]